MENTMAKKEKCFNPGHELSTNAGDVQECVADLIYKLRRIALSLDETKAVDAIENKGDVSQNDVESLIEICEVHLNDYCWVSLQDGTYRVDLDTGYLSGDFDGLKVDDLNKVPRGYTGEVLGFNDHGNTTLYRYTRGRGRVVWAVV